MSIQLLKQYNAALKMAQGSRYWSRVSSFYLAVVLMHMTAANDCPSETFIPQKGTFVQRSNSSKENFITFIFKIASLVETSRL